MGVPEVSIVIGCKKPGSRLHACLKSILSSTFGRFDVIVVTSEPVPLNKLLSDSRVRIDVLKLGSTAAKMRGASRAKSDFVVFLDDDTTVDPEWLKNTLKEFGDPAVGVVQPRLLLADGRRFDSAGGNIDRYGFYQERGSGQVDVGQFDSPVPIFWSSGSALAIRRNLFLTIGGYDLSDWGGIDIDLCWRVHLLGYKVVYAPTAKVFHHKSQTVRNLILRGLRLGYSGTTVSPHRQREVGWYIMCIGQLTILIKNYSTWNIVKRVPIALCVWGFSSFYFLARGEESDGLVRLSITIRAVVFAVLNFRRIYRRRKSTQLFVRRVSDNVIEQAMVSPLSAMRRARKRGGKW